MLKENLINIKNYIKKHNGFLYVAIRNNVLPTYLKIREYKLKSFKGQHVKNISFKNKNYNKKIDKRKFIYYKLLLDSKNGFVDQEIFWKGVYEEEVMGVLYKQISLLLKNKKEKQDTINNSIDKNNSIDDDIANSNIIFLDIGSNIGQELIFAAAIDNKVMSIGFEPLPHLYKQVKESIKINQEDNKNKVASENSFENVFIYNYALGENNDETNIKIPLINIGGSSLVRSATNTFGDIREEKIKVKNGDIALLEIFNEINNKILEYKKYNKIDIIKIDVEGYEYEVLNGLKETIKRDMPIIILEYSPAFYIGDYSDRGEKILKLMKDLDYKYTVIDGNINSDQANLLFIKR